ncbi:flagellar biosynthesis protein FlhB [Arsenophonus sp.]|uniref:flagellar biosynthesis protein FlhB n=1 Tax=Arsenophonus sp. TaxID=1872640 RepID=UPI002860082B|nr:flagellar biosynthesis protein FlhB [Arsenophonus sp.]MDR5615802.1 flagellar biosynthesis protein FlhB [Arsenophonus sp.]
MAQESDLEKTEEPTARKKEKAKEDGQVVRSRELSSFFILIAGVSLFWVCGHYCYQKLHILFSQTFYFNKYILYNSHLLPKLVFESIKVGLNALLPIIAGLVLIAFAAPSFFGGIHINFKSIKFDWKKLNPISGLKRIFSIHALAELFKALLKVILVSIGISLFVWVNLPHFYHLVTEPRYLALTQATQLMIFAAYIAIFMLIPLIGFDLIYQLLSHLKKLRMTRQEIKDEFKQQEGDPHIKARIRQQQREISRRRMMADVPKADVIIANPTHYAVALQYDNQNMQAPKVLAKGAGLIALNIKQLGEENRIPVLEAPPLARALYRHSKVGGHIPATLYAAVAEVLAWVYQLRRWQREGGLKPKKPTNVSVPQGLDFAGDNNTHG